ncbi:hypothetical protein GWI33_019442 [Rhynchophorus ferrugineus]|uniref:Cyclic nucleotide-binding domain-containing protein n=1 Tax=Rhynchophorus ferrugineus TaxID=354439 RepID=A0A834HUN3_RHYFE|nr:hypothetical protein GWI33_019442 [Rhynchophorus ferrugineus]
MVQHKYAEHVCDLALDDGGLTKLPPNAPFRMRFIRQIRRFLSPNPDAAISKRNYRNRSQICAERRRHARSKYFYIIHPYSDMQMLRDLVFIIIGTFEIITAPLNISFGAKFADDRYDAFFKYAGYRINMAKFIEINQWNIVKKYLRTYFIIDILLTLWIPNLDNNSSRIVYFLNLAIFFRTTTLCDAFKRFFQDYGFSDQVIQCIFLALISIYMVHIFTCIFYLLPFLAYDKNEFGSQLVWIHKADLVNNDNNMIVYISCLVLIESYMWGLGESLTRPENPIDLVVIIIVMIVGRLWSLFVIAILLRILTIRSMSESKYEEYLSQLETFIVQKNIPSGFRTMLLEYYRYKYQYHYFNERAIYNALSQYLRQELQLFVARGLISKVTIFKYLPKSTVSTIISKSKQMVFTTNKALILRNDPIDNIFFINYGTVAVLNATEVEITHLKDGDDIGLEGLFKLINEITHSYSYVATETTEVYVISVKEFRNLVPDKVDMKVFTKKVDQRTEEFNKIEEVATTQAVDLFSELKSGKILERPRIRTRYFEN